MSGFVFRENFGRMPLPLILPDSAVTVVVTEAASASIPTRRMDVVADADEEVGGDAATQQRLIEVRPEHHPLSTRQGVVPVSLLGDWEFGRQPVHPLTTSEIEFLKADQATTAQAHLDTAADAERITDSWQSRDVSPLQIGESEIDTVTPVPVSSNHPANDQWGPMVWHHSSVPSGLAQASFIPDDGDLNGLSGEDPSVSSDPANPPAVASDSSSGQAGALPVGAPLILRADYQSYDPEAQTITASGNVLVQLNNAQLAADRLWINLGNQYVRAEGHVFFNRNEQVIQGDTATYNLLQGSGQISNARGELLLSQVATDFSPDFGGGSGRLSAPIDYRLQGEGSISQVTSPGGVSFSTDSRQIIYGGERNDTRKLRFEAATVTFDADGWYIEELRLTNDPFSPPEIEFRGQTARLTPLNEEQDELLFDSPRFVFDQGLTIPVLQSRYVLNRGQLSSDELNPLPTGIGYDERDRDGLFIEREFVVNLGNPWRFTVVPQFYISRWLNESSGDLADPANFGFVARLNGPLGPRTSANASVSLSGLDLDNFADRLRASFRTQQLIGNHTLNLEYSYRDRLFNGTLGFQDVQSSLGLLVSSPLYTLGDSQITLQYQGSSQYVTANTDRPDLIADPSLGIDLTTLFRFQGAVRLGRWFPLWYGEALPATQTEGLRFSPRPVVPYLALAVGLTGVGTYYTSNDVQASLEASVGMYGQLGHLKQDFFDFTQFNLGFSSKLVSQDLSPFLFDREVDNNVLTGGILQQIYGPFLAGFQTSINIDSGQAVNTDVVLEYRRRSYGLVFRFNPVQQTGFLGFRLSDFDWQGQTAPFDGLGNGEPMAPDNLPQ